MATLTPIQEKRYTLEEFFTFTAQFPDKNFELIEGELIEMASSTATNTTIASNINFYLMGFVKPRKLGYVSSADGGFIISKKTLVIPDVAFVSKERATTNSRNVFNVAPDLAVEVISPSETHAHVMRKVNLYIQNGTKIVWAVYPDSQTVLVFTAQGENVMSVQTLEVSDTLDGGSVLPEFTLAIKEIFADMMPLEFPRE